MIRPTKGWNSAQDIPGMPTRLHLRIALQGNYGDNGVIRHRIAEAKVIVFRKWAPTIWFQMWQRLRGSPRRVGLVPAKGQKCGPKSDSYSGGRPQMWASSQSVETNVLLNATATQGEVPKCEPCPRQWQTMCIQKRQRVRGRLPNVSLVPVSGITCASKCGSDSGGKINLWASYPSVTKCVALQ